MNSIKLSDVAEILNGYAFKSKNYVSKGIRVIRIANVQNGYICDEKPCFYPVETQEEIQQYMLREGDLLVSLTGNVGRVGILHKDMLPAALNQRVCCIRINENYVLTKYLYFYFMRSQFIRECISASSGVAQLNLSPNWLKKKNIPVPPIEEQRRIVSRIEELFSELDSAVETLQKTRQQLEIYRQAVLKEAFQECTVSVKIEDVCIHVTDGDHMPPPKSETGIPFIMISNIQNNKINWNNTAFVDSNYFDKIIDKRRPQQGDVLYTVTGSFGIPVLIDFDKKFCFQRHIALLRPNEKINQKYLYYVMQNPIVYEQARNKATGTAQKTVGLSVLRKIEIPFVDSLVEQEKIVLNIENKMSVCDSIEKTVNECLQQAEAMRQSILKKAFEGEL